MVLCVYQRMIKKTRTQNLTTSSQTKVEIRAIKSDTWLYPQFILTTTQTHLYHPREAICAQISGKKNDSNSYKS